MEVLSHLKNDPQSNIDYTTWTMLTVEAVGTGEKRELSVVAEK